MKKYIITMMALSVCTSVISQGLEFVESMKGGESSKITAIELDSEGNIFNAGYFFDTLKVVANVNSEWLISNGDEDIFITKHDAQHELVWSKQIGGFWTDKLNGMVVDQDGNIYLTGFYTATANIGVNFGSDLEEHYLYGPGFFIIKLNPEGELIWATTTDGTAFPGEIGLLNSKSISLDTFGNTYVCGTIKGIIDFDIGIDTVAIESSHTGYYDGFIAKFDAIGQFLWAVTLPTKQFIDGDYGYASIVTDKEGNVYASGEFSNVISNSIDFDPGPGEYLVSAETTSGFVQKLDSLGHFLWARTWHGDEEIYVDDSTIDQFGNIFSTGYFQGLTDFDPGPEEYWLDNTFLHRDIYIQKLDTDGNFKWARSIEGINELHSMELATDLRGNVYLAGDFVDEFIDADPGVDTFLLYGGPFTYDLLILKLDSLGNFEWATSTDDEVIDNAYHSVRSSAVAVDTDENVYVAGVTKGITDFDISENEYIVTADNQGFLFFSKFGSNGVNAIVPGLSSIENITISPNPANGQIKIELGKEYKEISIRLLDGKGSQFFQKNYKNEEEINIDHIHPHGLIYVVVYLPLEHKIRSEKIINLDK